MHILMTDVLTCPRCGPRLGLILLADQMTPDRRVVAGALGCSNCREKYPIRRGVVDFTGAAAGGAAAGGEPPGGDTPDGDSPGPGATGSEPPGGDTAGDDEAALRIAALLGVSGGPGYVLLAGAAARHAPAYTALISDVEVVAATGAEHSAGPDAGLAGFTRLVLSRGLPLATGRMAGVFLGGDAADALLEEGVRTVAPLGRLVLEPAPDGAPARLEAAGMRVLLHEGATIIAVNRHAAG
jgi:uncharacterized protein YbaR (Trm112 family)